MEHQKITFFFTVFFVHRIVLFVVFFVHQIVLFSGFLRAPNRALSFLRAPNRAFLWFSSCTKSCFFCGFLRAPNRAPVHAFLFDDFASYTKSCSSSSFFVVFFVHQIVLFSGFLRAPSRAFFWFSSCTKSCFFCAFFVHQTVLFFTFLRAPNRAFFWFSSCTKSCFFCGFLRAPNGALLRATVTEVRQDTIYTYIFSSYPTSLQDTGCPPGCLSSWVSRNIGVLQFWTFEKGSLLESSGRIQKNYHLVMTNIAMRFLAGKIIYFYGPWLPWLC